jgi:hypothetical protein
VHYLAIRWFSFNFILIQTQCLKLPLIYICHTYGLCYQKHLDTVKESIQDTLKWRNERVQTTSGASCCSQKQETLHSLLSTVWFEEQIPECLYKAYSFIKTKAFCLFESVLRHIATVYGQMATFLHYWRKKISDALLCIISGTNWHPSKTTDIP